MPQRTCSVKGCEAKHHGQGLCSKHHMRLRRNGSVDTVRGRSSCAVDTCERVSHAKGYCTMHYRRLAKTGSPDGLLQAANGSGTINTWGYRVIYVPDHPLARSRRQVLEHRVVLYDHIGPGEHGCHWCGTSVSWDLSYPEDERALVVDHIDDDKLNNGVANLVPSCNACNVRRSNGCPLAPACSVDV